MSVRRALRTITVSATTGALALGAAWAGTGLVPVKAPKLPVQVGTGTGTGAVPAPAPAAAGVAPDPANVLPAPGQGQFLVGASKISMEPRPDASKGQRWNRNRDECAILSPEGGQHAATHVADFRSRWPENPDCLYMGGYGLGPMNPITSWEPTYGLYVRTVAVADAAGDTAVMTIIDATSYMAAYNRMCGPRGKPKKQVVAPLNTAGNTCGAIAIADSLRAELGKTPANFQLLLASTHSHTAPDLIGGWGGVPDWYMAQIEQAIKTSVRDAVRNMEPAVIEAGEVLARNRSGERRDFYRSAEDNTESWFRAYVPGDTPRVIATVGAFAAHPVTADEGGGVGNADFPGVFSKNIESTDGGTALFFQTGLGNMSPRGSTVEMGNGLADLIPAVGSGTLQTDSNVKVAQEFWDQPVTNSGLTALGVPGFFDRPFAQTPATLQTGKNPSGKPCISASPTSVRTSVSAARIGNLWVSGAPGEIFSNIGNVLEEQRPGGIVFPLAQVNDGLGYLVQSFETDHLGRQGVGFVGTVAEYEDAYSIDHCFGDKALETTIGLFGRVSGA